MLGDGRAVRCRTGGLAAGDQECEQQDEHPQPDAAARTVSCGAHTGGSARGTPGAHPPARRVRPYGAGLRPPYGFFAVFAVFAVVAVVVFVVFVAFAVLAAAFISCLNARTFASDSGPVMSATDRWERGSP